MTAVSTCDSRIPHYVLVFFVAIGALTLFESGSDAQTSKRLQQLASQLVELHQCVDQGGHVFKPDHIRAVTGRVVRILMGFGKDSGNTRRHGRAGQNRSKLSLAA